MGEFEAEMGKKLRATEFNRDYYEEHKAAGLDYLAYGPWQQQYGRWFVDSFGLKGKNVLDLGCACGSIMRGVGEAGAYVCGIEPNEHMVKLAVNAWPDMGPIIREGWAEDLDTHYGPQTFDAIHCAQVAEHWKPDFVPLILQQCWGVLRKSGVMFICLDTTELYERQGRKLEDEDPTHWCVKPRAWWLEEFAKLPLQEETERWKGVLDRHPESMSRRYDWDYFVVRRI